MRSPSTSASSKSSGRSSRVRRFNPIGLLMQAGLVALLAGFTYHQVQGYSSSPQAVLVLGGAREREHFAAEFAQEHPNLSIWVSSGSNPEYSAWIFAEAGIEPARVHLDYQAVDTVTNFTTLVDEFEAQGIDSIYLITSDYHMRRARVIGGIVLWSRGINFRPVPVPSSQPSESVDKVVRDAIRSVLWVFTGRTGSSLGQRMRESAWFFWHDDPAFHTSVEEHQPKPQQTLQVSTSLNAIPLRLFMDGRETD
jgi:uncharacterized SAM-binding protein YcdF (DUF218 family)